MVLGITVREGIIEGLDDFVGASEGGIDGGAVIVGSKETALLPNRNNDSIRLRWSRENKWLT
jgi:hypothetical protein